MFVTLPRLFKKKKKLKNAALIKKHRRQDEQRLQEHDCPKSENHVFDTSSTKDGCLLRRSRKTADMEPMSDAHMMLIDRRLPQVSHIKSESALKQNGCPCRAFHRGHRVTRRTYDRGDTRGGLESNTKTETRMIRNSEGRESIMYKA